MSDKHKQFLLFDELISVNQDKVDFLISSIKLLQIKISRAVKKKHKDLEFEFDLLGSLRTSTIIVNSKKIIDVDFGIYFHNFLNFKDAKQLIYTAVSNEANCRVEIRDKHIRLQYADYKVDITIYYLTNEMIIPRLARYSSWMPSDPKALYLWFEDVASSNIQIKRIVRYFKFWACQCLIKMPSGITFSVWVSKYICFNDRDDICFHETAKAILLKLKTGVYCRNPVKPHDNLVANLQPRQKRNFINKLELFVEQSGNAIKETNEKKSSDIWATQLGDVFLRII